MLVDFLLTSKAGRVTQVMAFIKMKTDEQMLDLCQFLSDAPEATDREILVAAEQIAHRPARSLLENP